MNSEMSESKHTPGPWTAAPEMLAEIERLRDALARAAALLLPAREGRSDE